MASNVMCQDCYLAMQNCNDITICCEMEEYDGDRCDCYEPMDWFESEEQEDE